MIATMKNKFILLFVLILLLPADLLAWGQKGHRIVAEIAYRHLSPLARHRVDQVLGMKRGIVYYSTWPDEIKSDTIYPTSFDWHFQDLDGGLSDEQLVAYLTDYPKEGGNLFRTTDSIKALLRQNRKQNHNLRFIVHFEGDRFCPMHTAHLDDLGGNKVKIKWFGTNSNLHQVWDEKIINARGYSYVEYCDYLESKYASQRREILRMTDEEVLIHNYHLCNEIYQYQEKWDGNAYNYVYLYGDACDWQLYAAGIRLAKLLNSLY